MEKLHFYPNKRLFSEIQGGRHLQNRHAEIMASRRHFNNNEQQRFGNEAALLPDDAWREVDEVTRRIEREDEGEVYMADLMPMSRAVDIGKTAHLYRVSSDIGNRVNISMNGQNPTLKDEVDYEFRGHPIPIFDTGYGLNWRKYRGMQSEGFDGISDDQEASVANLKQTVAQYVLNGDTRINIDTYIGYGITNHPQTNVLDLDASGFNIDLASFTTTSDAIEDFFVRDFQQSLHNNLVKGAVNIYASKEIERRWSRSYSGSSGFKGGTMHDFLMSLPFINSIKYTYEVDGNAFFAFEPKPKYIRLLQGMAITTIAIPRLMMTDDYNFKVMQATGIEITGDQLNRSAVFYAAEIA